MNETTWIKCNWYSLFSSFSLVHREPSADTRYDSLTVSGKTVPYVITLEEFLMDWRIRSDFWYIFGLHFLNVNIFCVAPFQVKRNLCDMTKRAQNYDDMMDMLWLEELPCEWTQQMTVLVPASSSTHRSDQLCSLFPIQLWDILFSSHLSCTSES